MTLVNETGSGTFIAIFRIASPYRKQSRVKAAHIKPLIINSRSNHPPSMAATLGRRLPFSLNSKEQKHRQYYIF
jgi:hypothetical protein